MGEKGYKVLVLEKGKWFEAKDFPKTNWNLKKWMWEPKLGLKGFFKMTYLNHVTVVSGVGVGGGSLTYANTLPVPKTAFFNTGTWPPLDNWQELLAPFCTLAYKMLGADPDHGVTDRYCRVYGYENMLVCDDSMISANPGVNPSLSITAISEFAMSQIPSK